MLDPPSPAAGSPDNSVVLDLTCRADWGAMPVGSGGQAHVVEGVMVHHAGAAAEDDDDEAARLLGYQRYHQDQGWPDIAYHLGIGRSGRCYELRDPEIAGDTFTEYDATGWFLILVDGDFDEQEPSAPQLRSLAMALAWASDRFAVPVGEVASHRDVAATTCPGDNLQGRLEALGEEAEGVLAGGGVELRPTCVAGEVAGTWLRT